MLIKETDLLALFQEEDFVTDDHFCQWLCLVLNETNPDKDYLSLLEKENLTLDYIQTFGISYDPSEVV